MKLGGRMLKTGLAVVLSLYICQWFNLTPPIIMVIAAVLTTQPTIFRSFKHFIEQLQANTIGVILGISVVYLLGNQPTVIGLTVIAVIIINLWLKFESSISLSIVTVIAVMGEPTEAMNRFMLILIGVFLSILINAFILPPNYENTLRTKIKGVGEDISLLLRNKVKGIFDEKSFREEKVRLHQELKKLDVFYELLKEETGISKKKKRSKIQRTVIYKHLIEALRLKMRGLEVIRTSDHKELEDEIQENIVALTQYFEFVYMKFEGKIKLKQTYQHIEKISLDNNEWIVSMLRKEEAASSLIHFLPMIAVITELTEHLRHTDQLVTSYLLYHNDNKKERSEHKELS